MHCIERGGKREDDYEHTIYWKKIDGLFFWNTRDNA